MRKVPSKHEVSSERKGRDEVLLVRSGLRKFQQVRIFGVRHLAKALWW